MLILQLKDGNETVFKQVYDLTHTKVYRYFLKRNATHDTARDLTQQTFIRLWQYRQTLKEDHTLDTQLFTVANSVLIDHLRRHTHRQQLQDSFSDLQPASTEQALLAYEQQDYLHAAIAHLPPVRQKVIRLRLIHGFSGLEPYFNWRRTKVPTFSTGVGNGNNNMLAMRYKYLSQDQSANTANYNAAIVQYGNVDDINGIMWILK